MRLQQISTYKAIACLVFLQIMVTWVHSLSFELQNRLSSEKHLRIFEKLREIQQSALYPSFRKIKRQPIKLTEFRVNSDKGMLAYYGEILVGEPKNFQKFQVLYDTGSTDIFLAGKNCSSVSCKNHKKYRPTKTFRFILQNEQIEYISGKLTATVGTDTVKIGNYTVKDQPIHIGEKVDIPIFEDSKWDGIVGLGFSMDQNNKTEETLLDNMVKQKIIKKNMFSYYIPNNKAYITFGEIPTSFVKNESLIQYSPLVKGDKDIQWVVSLNDIQLQYSNQRKMRLSKSLMQRSNPCQKGCKLLLDTGTYLNYIPKNFFKQFFEGQQFNENEDCNNLHKYPNIVFKVQGNGNNQFDLVLKPSDYFERVTEHSGKHSCVLSVCPDTEEQDIITLGQIFFKAYYSIFDFENRRIGFYAYSMRRW